MAKKKTSKVWIGLFVIIGYVIGVGSVVWLGASKCFECGKAYVAYFDESIQGLHPDSSVKLRGVNIGRVERIGVEPGDGHGGSRHETARRRIRSRRNWPCSAA